MAFHLGCKVLKYTILVDAVLLAQLQQHVSQHMESVLRLTSEHLLELVPVYLFPEL